MLKRLLAKLAAQPVPDLERFNDPLALSVAWSPMKPGGASFRTHKLLPVGKRRMHFRPTIGALLFYGSFLTFGMLLICGSIVKYVGGEDMPFVVTLLLCGSLFGGIGGVLSWSVTQPVVFDRRSGYFWKGRKFSTAKVSDRSKLKCCVKLKNIHALQIISEYCGGGGGDSFDSYELNLVLKDGRRENVVDHGNLYDLRKDTAQLAAFLGVPVWDVTI